MQDVRRGTERGQQTGGIKLATSTRRHLVGGIAVGGEAGLDELAELTAHAPRGRRRAAVLQHAHERVEACGEGGGGGAEGETATNTVKPYQR